MITEKCEEEQGICIQLTELESKMRSVAVAMMETGKPRVMLHGEELMDAAWIVRDWIDWLKGGNANIEAEQVEEEYP